MTPELTQSLIELNQSATALLGLLRFGVVCVLSVYAAVGVLYVVTLIKR